MLWMYLIDGRFSTQEMEEIDLTGRERRFQPVEWREATEEEVEAYS